MKVVKMTKDEFKTLFAQALDLAAQNAEKELGYRIPRVFTIELHAPGFLGRSVAPEAALDAVYLGDDRFYKIIDVAVKEVSRTSTTAFMRVSGHSPAEWSKTWGPGNSGPFKPILSKEIRQTA
jgi:hypothetical protein